MEKDRFLKQAKRNKQYGEFQLRHQLKFFNFDTSKKIPMVAELKKVMQKEEQLNSEEQKSIAKMTNDELEWENTLNDTQDKLASLAEEAIKEYQSGKTKKIRLVK